MIRKLINSYRNYRNKKVQQETLAQQLKQRKEYLDNGQIPWSTGYLSFRNEKISEVLKDVNNLQTFAKNQIPPEFGYRLDERIVEYSWIFSQLPQQKVKLLDAGSTFNYDFIVSQEILQNKELSILTYAPESPNFNEKRISYLYEDLRNIPFKDNYFDIVVSQSTIEHIDMDNSIYGYDITHNEEETRKSYEYLRAIKEMLRVLKNNGMLLLTFPFGKFEHHGFFQQFDTEMLKKLLTVLDNQGDYRLDFFRYTEKGWITCNEDDCKDIISYNPHTGRGKGTDSAAHCRSICCIKFIKY